MMVNDHGIIVRSIPYSDSARILHCFTENNGLVTLFTRIGKKHVSGHLQAGSFIQFTAREKAGSEMMTLMDSRWNPRIPTDPMGGEAAALWLFAVELLQKSLRERLILPQLYHRLSTYFGYLTQGGVSADPLVPLVVISCELGLSDVAMVFELAQEDPLRSLQLLGIGRTLDIPLGGQQSKEAFNIEIQRFQQHFGIERLGSLDLID
ncbi:MAG: recombination protein O N-terminal domain-containing protein [Flavobacteriales bacterium]|nr:recombination protein O N-terminal domain-containing protein [Flavobacteriales bacterium]